MNSCTLFAFNFFIHEKIESFICITDFSFGHCIPFEFRFLFTTKLKRNDENRVSEIVFTSQKQNRRNMTFQLSRFLVVSFSFSHSLAHSLSACNPAGNIIPSVAFIIALSIVRKKENDKKKQKRIAVLFQVPFQVNAVSNAHHKTVSFHHFRS